MDITTARIGAAVEAADYNWMLDRCPTYHSRVTHGLIIDIDDHYADAIVVRWIGPDGLQADTYELPAHSLVPSHRPAPPFTVEIRRRLTDGHYYSDEPDGSYFSAAEALFWLNSWSKYGGTQAPDPESRIPGAFTVTRPCGDYTEIRYLAALPTT